VIKTVVIDGNNLVHKAPPFKHTVNKSSNDVRLALAESVKSRLGNKIRTLFFFDGHGTETAGIKFSGNSSADDAIKKFIEKSKKPGELKIVSSDNDITGLARAYGCAVQSSEEFWSEIDKDNITSGKNINQLFIYDDKEKPSGLSKKDLKEFRKYFT
jgi:predicted RNA-binding protein with PIN domain